MPTSAAEPLVDRVRTLLAAEPTTREVSMFGGRSFMVNDKMVVSARNGEALLVRVSVDRDAELLQLPGADRAEMGAGRDMGPGWISVDSATIASDDTLSFWLEVALEHNRQVTRTAR